MSTAVEYTAQAASPLVNGEVKIKIGKNGLTATALFDVVDIPFAEMNELIIADYVVTIKADSGDYVFSRMGNWCEPFYDALCGVYNEAVLRSFFIKDKPLLTAKGVVPVHVYENCVVTLPPDLSARRIPLCFVSGMDRAGLELTLTLDTAESYSFAKLGYDTEPFADVVEKQIRILREQTISAAKVIDHSLGTAEASQIAKLTPKGAAAPFKRIGAIAPSFVSALEEKLAGTCACESYDVFKELCDPEAIYIGFNEDILWLIAPSPDGNFAAVEFATEDTATFVYRTCGDFENFAKQLNRALEAIDFKREVIRLSDEELKKPDNADYYMAAKRTEALQFIRKNYVCRVIHSGVDAWKRKLLESFK